MNKDLNMVDEKTRYYRTMDEWLIKHIGSDYREIFRSKNLEEELNKVLDVSEDERISTYTVNHMTKNNYNIDVDTNSPYMSAYYINRSNFEKDLIIKGIYIYIQTNNSYKDLYTDIFTDIPYIDDEEKNPALWHRVGTDEETKKAHYKNSVVEWLVNNIGRNYIEKFKEEKLIYILNDLCTDTELKADVYTVLGEPSDEGTNVLLGISAGFNCHDRVFCSNLKEGKSYLYLYTTNDRAYNKYHFLKLYTRIEARDHDDPVEEKPKESNYEESHKQYCTEYFANCIRRDLYSIFNISIPIDKGIADMKNAFDNLCDFYTKRYYVLERDIKDIIEEKPDLSVFILYNLIFSDGHLFIYKVDKFGMKETGEIYIDVILHYDDGTSDGITTLAEDGNIPAVAKINPQNYYLGIVYTENDKQAHIYTSCTVRENKIEEWTGKHE